VSQHDHDRIVEGCFRCELGADEVIDPEPPEIDDLAGEQQDERWYGP
jgi:hypothetical protein